MHYDLTTLPSGLRVITEPIEGIRSVAVGCWVDTGTRDENPNEAGASHFLEHLLFKGSETVSAREISEKFESMGAVSNAFTSQEYTCFWARLLDEDLPDGVGLLAEMLQRPAFRQNEIDSERQVVIEEINMNQDDPSDVAFERFMMAALEGHPLERPVLGTRESIRGMRQSDIAGYWQRRYGSNSTVIAVAGAIEHEAVVELIEKEFGAWNGEAADHSYQGANVTKRVDVVRRETEQAHLILGGEGIRRSDDRRYAHEILNQILGGGMASRLFRAIREERGLAYAVYSFRMPFTDVGLWGIYAGTTPAQTATVLDLISAELAELVDHGISQDEMDRAQGNLRGSMALALEDANSRMVRLGRDEMTGSEHLSVGERIKRVEAVTLGEVHEAAKEVLTGPRVLGAVGPFDVADLEEMIA